MPDAKAPGAERLSELKFRTDEVAVIPEGKHWKAAVIGTAGQKAEFQFPDAKQANNFLREMEFDRAHDGYRNTTTEEHKAAFIGAYQEANQGRAAGLGARMSHPDQGIKEVEVTQSWNAPRTSHSWRMETDQNGPRAVMVYPDGLAVVHRLEMMAQMNSGLNNKTSPQVMAELQKEAAVMDKNYAPESHRYLREISGTVESRGSFGGKDGDLRMTKLFVDVKSPDGGYMTAFDNLRVPPELAAQMQSLKQGQDIKMTTLSRHPAEQVYTFSSGEILKSVELVKERSAERDMDDRATGASSGAGRTGRDTEKELQDFKSMLGRGSSEVDSVTRRDLANIQSQLYSGSAGPTSRDAGQDRLHNQVSRGPEHSEPAAERSLDRGRSDQGLGD